MAGNRNCVQLHLIVAIGKRRSVDIREKEWAMFVNRVQFDEFVARQTNHPCPTTPEKLSQIT